MLLTTKASGPAVGAAVMVHWMDSAAYAPDVPQDGAGVASAQAALAPVFGPVTTH